MTESWRNDTWKKQYKRNIRCSSRRLIRRFSFTQWKIIKTPATSFSAERSTILEMMFVDTHPFLHLFCLGDHQKLKWYFDTHHFFLSLSWKIFEIRYDISTFISHFAPLNGCTSIQTSLRCMIMQMSLQSAVAMVQQARMLCRAVQLGIQLSEDACNFFFLPRDYQHSKWYFCTHRCFFLSCSWEITTTSTKISTLIIFLYVFFSL